MKTRYTNRELIASAPVRQAVLKLSLPTLLGALMGLVYNLTDTLFISLLRDYAQIASLSLAMPVTWIISSVGAVIANGAPAYISRKYGGGDMESVRRGSSFSLWSTLGVGLLLMAALLPSLTPILRLMGASDATLGHARSYLAVLVAFGVVNLAQATLQGLLRAEGKTQAASFSSILGMVTNIVLDPVLIFGLGMGIRGAAWATAAGYVVSGVYCLVKLQKGGTVLSLRLSDCRPDRAMVREMLSVGDASALSTLIVCVPMVLGNRFASGYSDQLLAAVGVAAKVYSIVATMATGFSMGLQPFIGYNHGAGQRQRMLKGMLTSAAMGSVLCLLCEAAFALFPRQLISIFSDDPEVVGYGSTMLRYFLICTPFVALEKTMTTYLAATGRALQTTFLNLVQQIGLFAPLALLLSRSMGPNGLMLAQPLAALPTLALAGALSAAALRKDLDRESLAAVPEAA